MNSARSTTVNLFKQFINTNYNVQITISHCSADWSATVNSGVQQNSKTISSFILQNWYNSSNTSGSNDWMACGQLALDQYTVPQDSYRDLLIKY